MVTPDTNKLEKEEIDTIQKESKNVTNTSLALGTTALVISILASSTAILPAASPVILVTGLLGSLLGISKKEINQKKINKIFQTKLKEKGFYQDEIDGIIGSKTIEAIKSFQKNNMMSETGEIDNITMEKLIN